MTDFSKIHQNCIKNEFYNLYDKVTIHFQSNDSSFHNFVNRFLWFFRSDRIMSDTLLEACVIKTNSLSKVFQLVNREDLKRIGWDTYLGEKEIIYLKKSFLFDSLFIIKLDNQKLNVTVLYQEKLIKNLFRGILKFVLNKNFKEEFFQNLLRETIYFPLFTLLEKFGIYLLHGVCLEYKNEGFAFLGLNGVGKTSLALHLISIYNFSLIAENFILFDNSQTYSFPEVMRIPSSCLHLIPKKKQKNLPKLYGKYHLTFNNKDLPKIGGTNAIKTIFLMHGNATQPFIRKIDSHETLIKALAMDTYLHEFHNYSIYSLLALLSSSKMTYPDLINRNNSYRILFNECKCFDLFASKDVEATARLINNLKNRDEEDVENKRGQFY
ncbi:MAG: hypothetical protein AM326_00105 [Candidatus Thorarchaeota archaeon SMTZ-45]|nr:MAG: hypothetical protein AM326_00105 [Candidatus Thorarchaeota archaeon SMTZ-45]